MKYLTGQQEKEAIRWMNKAAEVAKKALCLKAKCGSVIVNDGEIIGEGYNAPPLDREENRSFHLRVCAVYDRAVGRRNSRGNHSPPVDERRISNRCAL
ncbi:MAG: hypothetical protein HYW88_02320 [Candidatus Sungbacteria bacterium]|nr:hypothetical protein [Candidatus Sungbacteria bacterium]